jgi:hypothetical protein
MRTTSRFSCPLSRTSWRASTGPRTAGSTASFLQTAVPIGSGVEQKNGAVIRRLVGDGRFQGVEAARALARLFAAARLHINFFQPSFKLREKRRVGAKVIKRYHAPATPYARALAHPAAWSSQAADTAASVFGSSSFLGRSGSRMRYQAESGVFLVDVQGDSGG